MIKFRHIAVILFALLTGCSQPGGEKPNKIRETTSPHPLSIIFGVYCGECMRHCATMYCYNMTGNSTNLFVDSTDSYFKNSGNIVCNTPVTDTGKFQIASTLVQKIPASFSKQGPEEQRFGCPDCTDGCGIYFEWRQAAVTRKFYIDYNTYELDKEVKEFGELIKKSLERLEQPAKK